jgi:tubulin-folding cofactor B
MADYVQKSDHQLVRDYITAHDHLQYSQLPEDVVAITMTHSNLLTKHVDLRFNLHNTIGEVKERFRVHIGTPPEHQHLVLKNNGQTICQMSDNNRKLGYYSVLSGMEIHIVDSDPFSLSRNGGLTDVSLVQKYTISEEAYDNRKGTVRDFIRQKKKEDPNYKVRTTVNTAAGTPSTDRVIPGPESVDGIVIGMRCEVMPGARRGTVRFVGEVPEITAGGHWVGVELDEPLGHNNGHVKGNQVFTCPTNCGAFVRGKHITVGDFPVRDIFDEDDDEAEEAKENQAPPAPPVADEQDEI